MKNIVFKKVIDHTKDREDPERVKFVPIPARFHPRAGLQPDEARLLYQDISNCKKCDFGLGHFYQPMPEQFPDVWIYKSGKLCPEHKERSGGVE